MNAGEIATLKARLNDLGLHVPAYRLDAIPADPALAASYWISPRHSRSRSFSRDSRPISKASKWPSRTAAACTSGQTIVGANLRDAAKASPLLLELSKQQPPEAPEWPNKCTDCGTSRPTNKPLFFTIVPGAAENYDKAVRVAQGYRVNAISKMLPITTADRIPADERAKIDAAIPGSRWRSPGRRENC